MFLCPLTAKMMHGVPCQNHGASFPQEKLILVCFSSPEPCVWPQFTNIKEKGLQIMSQYNVIT